MSSEHADRLARVDRLERNAPPESDPMVPCPWRAGHSVRRSVCDEVLGGVKRVEESDVVDLPNEIAQIKRKHKNLVDAVDAIAAFCQLQEKMAARKDSEVAAAVAKSIKENFAELFSVAQDGEDLRSRLEALEAVKTMSFHGPHDPSKTYGPGSVAQKAGACYVALVETDDSPGASPAWRRIATDR